MEEKEDTVTDTRAGGSAVSNIAATTVAGAIALLLATFLPVSSTLAVEGCPNDARRGEELVAYLPNCRAYEEVSPVAKDSGEPEAVEGGLHDRRLFEPIRGAHSAVDGERLAWVSEYFLPGLEFSSSGVAGASSPGLDYLSSRSQTSGWSTQATVPPQSPENGLACFYLPGLVAWSSNLDRGVLADGDAQEHNAVDTFFQQIFGCGHAEPALKEANGSPIREPEGFQNLFLRDSDNGSYQLVNITPSTAPQPTPKEDLQDYFPPNFLAGSAALGRVVFEDELPLNEEAEGLSPTVEVACKEEPTGRACWEGHDDLYEWSEGEEPAVRLVSILPNGEPVPGMLAGSTRNAASRGTLDRPVNIADYRHAVSADGSRIFFEAEGNLYVRENGDRPQSALGPQDECTEPERACTIQLDLAQGGSESGGGRWLAASDDGARVFFTDELDLTSTATATSGEPDLYEYNFDARGGEHLKDLTQDTIEPADVLGVSGTSEGGSYVYFVADGVLPDSGQNSQRDAAHAGQPNLYLRHSGAITFIATLSPGDLCDWTSNTGCNLEEPANPELTGLTARVSRSGQYLAFNSLSQLTAYDNTDTMTMEADEEIFLYEAESSRLVCASCNPNGAPSSGGAVIDWPAPPDTNSEMRNFYPQRNVSEAGQVFFETSEALLPQQDTNGVRDVYEYEHGTLHLVSSGASSAPSYFVDASASGSDVFFVTAQKLLPRDIDAAYDIYDARVDGGLPEPATLPPPCGSENECQGSAGASQVFSAPPSTALTGSGNLRQATTSKPKPKRAARHRRKSKLRRESRACARRYRHDAHKRIRCQKRAHSRPSQKNARPARHGSREVER